MVLVQPPTRIKLHADTAYDAVIIDAYDADGNVPKTFSSDGPFLEAGIWTIWCAPLLTDVVFKKNMHWTFGGQFFVSLQIFSSMQHFYFSSAFHTLMEPGNGPLEEEIP